MKFAARRCWFYLTPMRDLVATNDPILLSYLLAILREAGIEAFVFDRNMSSVQGSLGAVTQRVSVPEDHWEAAKRLLIEADLGQWILET
ncbi:DUF2007 domain-containing protein [Hyphomicrobium sp. D-2]|uniref:putative signal transducing protein n=1 Tax=Hyphomicrobium sp. D-2 TaxID=3041621 RepID=UPI0024538423|nr:DUF2007 domain-containing protein [Hyphomicrobium sp. D-2]MDH4983772.1 DUF2007 domain-containing protein [Hyphomicrobium sp. D-2]